MKIRHILKITFLLLIIISIFIVKVDAKEKISEINLGEPIYYELKPKLSNVEMYLTTEDNTVNPSIQLSHSKDEIIERYNDAKFTLTNDTTYSTEAVLIGPNYKAATLTDLAKSDTLKYLNLYRYLSGTRDVSLHDSIMNYNFNGKGAVLLAKSNFSHTPNKPADMDDTFFTEATYGTSYPPYEYWGTDIYGVSGNIAYGTNLSLPKSIKGYIDDTSNVVLNSVGHRLSLLSPRGLKTSFGSVTTSDGEYENMIYSSMTMFSGSYTSENQIYTWPPAGYCPIEVTHVNELWSITLDSNLNYEKEISGSNAYANVKIILTCDGIDYEVKSKVFCSYSVAYNSDSYNTFYFAIPNDLKTKINGGNTYLSGKKVTVRVISGITRGSENVELNYDVDFFTIDKIDVTDMIILDRNANLQQDPYIQTFRLKGYVGDEREFLFQFIPENATDTRFSFDINTSDIASFDMNNQVLTFTNGGNGNCIIKSISNPNVSTTIPISVYNHIQSIDFNESSYSLTIGDSLETNVLYTPNTYLLDSDKVLNYEVGDPNIISVDENGVVTGLKVGETTLTAKTNGNLIDTTNIIVEDIVITTINSENIDNFDDAVMRFDTNIKFNTILTSENFPALDRNYTVKLYDSEGNIKNNNDNLGSKNIIKIFDKNGIYVTQYNVAIKGDISGNGKAELFDSFKILIGVLTDSNLDELDMIIRDFNNDGIIALYDAFNFLIQAITS